MVWKIANDSSENAQKIRKFLVTLSGKLIERNKEFTYPALLSGLESYLTTIDLLTRFSVDEIFKLKDELEDIIGFKM